MDAGADAFLARVPEGRALAVELGMGDDLVSPATGAALVVRGGRLHPLPDGLVLGVPAGLGGLARSGLISRPGKLRALGDLVIGRRDHGDSLGRLIAARFGREVADYLVDPLVGSINAGSIDDLSLSAATPQIAPAAARRRSLLLALRSGARDSAAGGPVFLAPRTGMGSLVERLTDALSSSGVALRLGHQVSDMHPHSDGGWHLDDLVADGVVLAVPAFALSRIVAPAHPVLAGLLADVPYAGVVMATMLVPREELARIGAFSGYLVPKPERGAVTAASFASRKWPHWSTETHEVLRVSLGHIGDQRPLGYSDDEVQAVACAELGRHLGLGRALRIDEIRVTRWPEAFPQYRPGHTQLIERIDREVAESMPGVVLAGAAYRGLGIPACIRDGRRAARLLRARAGGTAE